MAFLPSHSTVHETAALLKMTGITSIFASEARYSHVIAAAKEIGIPEDGIFILQGDIAGKVSFPRSIEAVKSRGLPRVPSQTVQDDTLAYLMFSSGTTGPPKGLQDSRQLSRGFLIENRLNVAVMISHRNLMFSTLQSFAVFEEVAKLGAVRGAC
jgi:acyl-CoA synthetase (AMP-forming)/AMP-acid ligase II